MEDTEEFVYTSCSLVNESSDIKNEIQYTYHFYIFPVIVTLGVTGNIISILIFLKKELRTKSFATYLIVLTTSDMVHLISLIFYHHILLLPYDTESTLDCLDEYLVAISGLLSSWIDR